MKVERACVRLSLRRLYQARTDAGAFEAHGGAQTEGHIIPSQSAMSGVNERAKSAFRATSRRSMESGIAST